MPRKENIENLRRAMGTLPDQNPPLKTDFYRGVEGVEVKLVAWPHNPYKGIFTIATSTWGKKIDKWEDVAPENRFKVVKAAVTGNTLPTALESVQLTFAIDGVSRSSYDQTARLRIGAGIGARGTRDNNHRDTGFRIPEELHDDIELIKDIQDTVLHCKATYDKILSRGNKSWQSARCILPMGMLFGCSITISYLSLKGYCAKRMKFCEQEDTVATAWMCYEALRGKFPFLANYLRPGCDFSHKCQYHQAYSLSELFGCLFKECGRNICDADYEYADFNNSCSDAATISSQLGIQIPGPYDWPDINWETLDPKDKLLFEQD